MPTMDTKHTEVVDYVRYAYAFSCLFCCVGYPMSESL